MTNEEPLEERVEEGIINEKTEMGAVFDNLDNDRIDPASKFSKIDFNARLTDSQICSCKTFDEFKALGLFPNECNISTQTKRLSVSLKGMGRSEKVQIASAGRDADLSGKAGGLWGRMKNAFTPGQQ